MLKTRSRVAFIDDSAEFLRGAILAVSPSFAATFHRLPETLEPVLQASACLVAREQARLMEIAGAQLSASASAAPHALAYFANEDRFAVTSVLVADYGMPKEDGVALCARHRSPGLQRILLTGVANQEQAIDAFNARCIDMFIHKRPQIMGPLHDALSAHMDESAAARGDLLRQTLSPSLAKLFAQAPIAAAVRAALSEAGVAEYMVLGSPQGVLGVTSQGRLIWVQLEDDASLQALVEALQEQAWPSPLIEPIHARAQVVNIDLASQLGLRPCSAPMQILCTAPFLGAAVFDLGSAPSSLQPAKHSTWLAGHYRPTIES